MLKRSLGKIRRYLFGGVAPRLHAHISLMRWAKGQGYAGLAQWVARRIQLKYSVFISPRCTLEGNIEFRHPVGIVVGDGVTLADGVVLYQHVTLGGARQGDAGRNNYPSVDEGTVIFAGAVVVGGIRIGKHCTIGANAVVTTDVPDGATAVGIPARIIQKNPEQNPGSVRPREEPGPAVQSGQ